MTPLGISKKDIINMGKLLKTELIRTSLPHKIGILLSNKKVSVGNALLPCSNQNSRVVYGALEYLGI